MSFISTVCNKTLAWLFLGFLTQTLSFLLPSEIKIWLDSLLKFTTKNFKDFYVPKAWFPIWTDNIFHVSIFPIIVRILRSYSNL